jgi:hypothetical protein
MTYQNDPHNRTPERKISYGWIVGCLIAVAVVFVIMTMYRHNSNYTASTAGRGTLPTSTTNGAASPATTGSAGIPTAPAVPAR